MMQCDPDQPPDDRDLLAAEYVVGLLGPEEMRDVEAEAIGSPSLAASVLAWQARLHPMTEAVPPVDPPDAVWQRLEATLGLARAPRSAPQQVWWRWGSVPAWRGALIGAVSTAAIGGAVLGPRLLAPKEEVAALISLDGEKPNYKVETTPDGIASVVTINPSDSTLQLWTLDGGTPVSLGLLPRKGRYRIKKQLLPGAKLLISREPKGGSPEAVPTGPVIYQGNLIRG